MSLVFAQVIGDGRQSRQPQQGDGYDMWHAVLASAADIFVTRDDRLEVAGARSGRRLPRRHVAARAAGRRALNGGVFAARLVESRCRHRHGWHHRLLHHRDRLRREAQRQTELQIRPFLTLGYDPDDRRLYVQNIGRGVARNIHADALKLSEEGLEHPIVTQWEAIDYIAPDQQRELIGQPTQAGVPVPDSQGAWRSNFGAHGRREYEFVVQYDDLAGSGYRARRRRG